MEVDEVEMIVGDSELVIGSIDVVELIKCGTNVPRELVTTIGIVVPGCCVVDSKTTIGVVLFDKVD